ncbi:hypothetical protein HUT19_33450 [Streptomyces sp. NA02950]|uniref:hypothetical protein n=1 Tax=Streptomyces sp. NA02950 TaxID=2742137 RepID=UPI001591C145|nr:hypothetical protein [Streptomyces sp. NA02950]QKV96030.1 hypothetical protein HUT19_33450 [Streptomyces sp. NA02950]
MTAEETSGSTADREAGVRRAITLPATSGDPAAVLPDLHRQSSGQATAAAVVEPNATYAEPATVEPPQRAVPARLKRGILAGRRNSEAGQLPRAVPDAAAPDAEAAAAPDAEAAAAETRGEAGLGVPESATAARSEPARPGTAGDTPPGRPNKPMLAAAALAGVVLLGVPILLIGGDDKDHKGQQNVANSRDDTVLGDAGQEQPPSGKYAPSTPEEERDSPGKKGDSPGEKRDSLKPDRPFHGNGPHEKAAKAPEGNTKGGNGEQEAAKPQASSAAISKQAKPSAKVAASGHWETKERSVTNAQTGLCLTTVNGREVGQGSCGGSSVWTRYVMPDGTALLKLKSANRCLDNDGGNLYVSSCTPNDAGQVWRTPSAGDCEVVLQASGGALVTGWNDKTVSMRARGDAGDADKQKWGFSRC